MKTNRISYSSVDDFKECPQKMYNKKKYTMVKQASAFAFGSALESGTDVLVKGGTLEEAIEVFEEEWHVRPANKWEGERQIFDSEDVFYYNSDFDKYLMDEELYDEWSEELDLEIKDYKKFVEGIQDAFKKNNKVDDIELRMYNRILWHCCLERGPYMLEAFEAEILPTIEEVIDVQKEVLIENEDGDKVTGYIDYIVKLKGEKYARVMDLKTAGRMYDDHKIKSSDQLGIYTISEGLDHMGYWIVLKKLKHTHKCDACGRVRDNYRCRKCEDNDCKGRYTVIETQGTTQTLKKTISKEDKQYLLDEFSEVLVAFSNGIKWRNPNSCFNYNTRCEFYEACWEGKSLDELTNIKKRDE